MLYLASQQIVDAYDKAFWTITIACLLLMIGIMAALVLFAVKYHRSRHPKPARIHGNLRLEIFWTIVPTLISLWMFFVGYDGFMVLRTVPDDAYVVQVEGRQWAWTFTHPKTGVTDSELHVPVGVPIKCELSSPIDGVLHSFFIPAFRVKEDCVPGLDTYMWFQCDEESEYNIFCAEFCGNDHAKMITRLYSHNQADFDKYLEGKLKTRFAPVTDVAAVMSPTTAGIQSIKVKPLYDTYCASCHGENGEGGLVEGARSFTNDAASKWKKSPKITDIFKTLTLGIPDTRMKAFDNLSAWERFALAHYVAAFYKDGPSRSVSELSEYQQLVKEYKLDEQRSVIVNFPIEDAIQELAEGK